MLGFLFPFALYLTMKRKTRKQSLYFLPLEYGHYLSPEKLATRGDSIVHELITSLGPRIQRIFILEEAKRMY